MKSDADAGLPGSFDGFGAAPGEAAASVRADGELDLPSGDFPAASPGIPASSTEGRELFIAAADAAALFDAAPPRDADSAVSAASSSSSLIGSPLAFVPRRARRAARRFWRRSLPVTVPSPS